MAQYPPLIMDEGTIRQFGGDDELVGPQALAAVKIGAFICPEVLGNYSVTGLGFKPKSVKFWVSKKPGLRANFACCQGMMDQFGNQNSMTWAGSSTLFNGNSRINKCMYTINAAGNTRVIATFVSMDNDGFTVNFMKVNRRFLIRWEALA